MIMKMRKIKGCFDEYPAVKYKVENVNYKTCIGNFFDKTVVDLYEAFNNYERGVMPFSGSYMDQPAKIVEVFGVIGGMKNIKIQQMQEQEMKKHDSKMKGLKKPTRGIKGVGRR